MTSTFCPAADPAGVDDGLQGGAPGDGDDRGLLPRHGGRAVGELVLAGDRVLGDRARGDAEDLVADRERRHLGADLDDDAGDVAADDGLLRRPQAEDEAQQPRLALHEVPRAAVEPGGADAPGAPRGADHGTGDLGTRRTSEVP